MLGTPDKIEIKPGTLYFNTLYSSTLRRRAAERVISEGGTLQGYFDKSAKVSSNVAFGKGCMVLDNCTILERATVGRCSFLKSCFVDYGAQIGDYCTLERGCWIGEGALIEDDVVIGPQTKIAPGVRIAKGKVIPAFSVINEDVV